MIAGFALIFSLVGAPATVHKSAIIIGVNEAFEPSQPTLRYADDDAARFFEMLSPEVEHLELLALLDGESQSLYGTAAAAARAPDHATLLDALERAAKASQAARDAGRRTELYFIYTGHGRVEGGEGVVKLAGGALTRTELTERVLKSRAFDRIHVIVDACNAYHLVSARGDDDTAPVTTAFDAAFDRFVEEHALDKFPSAGFVLSTSGAGASHEWSRYQGGVFSHEIRSALAGAADANEDKRVDYTEIEAFLASANMKVPELKGRPKVFVRPPALEREAALYAPSKVLPELELPAPLSGHFFLEDDRGIRYAELNKAEGHPVLLRLVPRGRYQLVRAGGGEVATVEAASGLRVAMPIEERPLPNVARGDEAPSGAFAEAFGPRFVDGFRAASQSVLAPSLAVDTEAIVGPKLRVAGYVAAAAGVAAIGASVWQALEAGRAYRPYQDAYSYDEKVRIEAEVRDHRARATGLGVLGGVALSGALTVFLLDAFD